MITLHRLHGSAPGVRRTPAVTTLLGVALVAPALPARGPAAARPSCPPPPRSAVRPVRLGRRHLRRRLPPEPRDHRAGRRRRQGPGRVGHLAARASSAPTAPSRPTAPAGDPVPPGRPGELHRQGHQLHRARVAGARRGRPLDARPRKAAPGCAPRRTRTAASRTTRAARRTRTPPASSSSRCAPSACSAGELRATRRSATAVAYLRSVQARCGAQGRRPRRLRLPGPASRRPGRRSPAGRRRSGSRARLPVTPRRTGLHAPPRCAASTGAPPPAPPRPARRAAGSSRTLRANNGAHAERVRPRRPTSPPTAVGRAGAAGPAYGDDRQVRRHRHDGRSSAAQPASSGAATRSTAPPRSACCCWSPTPPGARRAASAASTSSPGSARRCRADVRSTPGGGGRAHERGRRPRRAHGVRWRPPSASPRRPRPTPRPTATGPTGRASARDRAGVDVLLARSGLGRRQGRHRARLAVRRHQPGRHDQAAAVARARHQLPRPRRPGHRAHPGRARRRLRHRRPTRRPGRRRRCPAASGSSASRSRPRRASRASRSSTRRASRCAPRTGCSARSTPTRAASARPSCRRLRVRARRPAGRRPAAASAAPSAVDRVALRRAGEPVERARRAAPSASPTTAAAAVADAPRGSTAPPGTTAVGRRRLGRGDAARGLGVARPPPSSPRAAPPGSSAARSSSPASAPRRGGPRAGEARHEPAYGERARRPRPAALDPPGRVVGVGARPGHRGEPHHQPAAARAHRGRRRLGRLAPPARRAVGALVRRVPAPRPARDRDPRGLHGRARRRHGHARDPDAARGAAARVVRRREPRRAAHARGAPRRGVRRCRARHAARLHRRGELARLPRAAAHQRAVGALRGRRRRRRRA